MIRRKMTRRLLEEQDKILRSYFAQRYDREPNAYIHTYIRTNKHTYTYIHTYIHAHMHTYIRTHIHTYIHTYIHLGLSQFSARTGLICSTAATNAILSLT